MEKKLKINFILKGIVIFAFVAFCLLAILAGVTLPFVSNASTLDCVVINSESDCATASAESDVFNPLDFCISLGECNSTDTYYGFYISNFLWSYIKQYDYSQTSGLLELFNLSFSNNSIYYVVSGKSDGVAYLALTDMNNYMFKYFEDYFAYSYFSPYIVYTQGFKLSNILSYVPSGSLWSSHFKVFTSVPYGYKTEIVSNYGFQSRFGYIGDLKNNRMYFNLHGVPKIPDDIYCPYRDNTLVNYNKIGNDYYLSIVDAYDSSGNVVSDVFSGWKFTNNLNPDKTPSSFYSFDFYVRGLRVCHIDTVQFVDNCFTTPNYDNIYYTVNTSILDGTISAYASEKTQFLYSLRSYLTKDDVRDFFALFDYISYVPVDDAFYLAGFNSASKGYYDDGYNKGYSVGEDVGYNTGFSAGDARGYARGVEAANTYSFLGLFGAIFDAPIKAIFGGTSTLPAGTTITDSNGNTITLQSTTTVNRAGFLNFNLMGVNLSGFVLALFSISILIAVIKFALSKR